ncbi:MAG TPA: hypothetical protein VN905_01690 [Candidatus Binatia bacterium]|nr:hypothetical protein [Candidatus Binatia bacterium]
MNSNDPSAFVVEIDGRVSGYLAEIRERADAAKADLESGVLSMRSKAQPGGQPAAQGGEFGSQDGQGSSDVTAEASFEELTALEDLPQLHNGSHPLDAPIFGDAASDSDSFLSDDLDFSIDLDENLPS